MRRMSWCWAGWAAMAVAGAVQAGPVLQKVQAQKLMRVCIWPDYYGVSYRNPKTDALSGIDIDLSAELAKDLGVKLERVDSSFPKLIEDLTQDRCDVAMFAVGVLPQRAQHLRFTEPYLQSDMYGVTTRSNRQVKTWDDIDQAGVMVGVQAATFMEPVMRERLKKAEMVVIKPPQTREQELEAGRIDVFMTDYPYSRRLLDSADWARLVAPEKPFFVLPYAYAVKPGDDEWLKTVNAFVQRIKKDGRLQAAAQKAGLSAIVISR
ncbi:amino acid ABC transporter substrate-binding protein [Inhella crocodyli]|uniref:Amino acid ABC transporter substrate-binding protein n=2 Tax=Inhella crocodyli TaxID=2499851 RepID=A0A437LQL2_9BURK|nr:amino acid ABC transporter substrate-binding protein [Inhella crocodyli]